MFHIIPLKAIIDLNTNLSDGYKLYISYRLFAKSKSKSNEIQQVVVEFGSQDDLEHAFETIADDGNKRDSGQVTIRRDSHLPQTKSQSALTELERIEAERDEMPWNYVGLLNQAPLEAKDMWRIPQPMEASSLAQIFEEQFKKDLAENEAAIKEDEANAAKIFVETLLQGVVSYRIFNLGVNIFGNVSPLFISFLLTYASNRAASLNPDSEYPIGVGFAYAVVLFVLQVLAALCGTNFFQYAEVYGIKVKTSMMGMIYRKSLRLSSASRQEFSSGRVITMVSTDTARMEFFMTMINIVWTAPFNLAMMVGFLIYQLGWPALVGVAILVALIPIQYQLFKVMMALRRKVAPITDKRVKIINEVLSGIRVIKFFGWEEPFLNTIEEIRKTEIGLVLTATIYRSLGVTIGVVFPVLAASVSFLVSDASRTFIFYPMLANAWADFKIALARIECSRFRKVIPPNAIIGEMKRESGDVIFSGNLGYAPQQAWIQNASVKENILFGNPYDEERYRHVIETCALGPDLKKQRINLARLVYYSPDIALMDALKNQTRILVTHQLHFLSRADQVIVMRDGEIVEVGTYQKLWSKRRSRQETSPKAIQQVTAASKEAVKPEDPTASKAKNIMTAETGTLDSYFLRLYKFDNVLTSEGYIGVYFAFGVSLSILTFLFGVFFALSGTRAAKHLQKTSIGRVIHAPVYFFDTNPLGRILNRFSKDQDAIDQSLAASYQSFASSLASTISTFALMIYATPIFAIPLVPILALYYFLQRLYRNTSRELKRLDSLPTIRAYGVQSRFIRNNDAATNGNNSPYFLLIMAQNWLATRLQVLGSLLVFFAAMFGVLAARTVSVSLLGLQLTYALNVTQILNQLMVEIEEGSIWVDGLDVGKIGLFDLRSKLAVIPQDPVLFSGTFRTNLDPFAEHTDGELWDAVTRAGLKAKVSESSEGLDGKIQDGGENLSVGQKQLLCLARAMLKTPKFSSWTKRDTANVDYDTDAFIQKALRSDLKKPRFLQLHIDEYDH
ncbi:hypothetical protein BCR33DRAFT_779780 [Rhizoclosmatium globosum]|uniref:ABC transmembrane type-1 domain-containing protein n=1 Tax=Rhizoclosmatium globosum TaxID=329046 RepID=A0A1Y2D1L9_9FUNG|nr:hypothetical protein BCR33DRAFT_779780 [Rhizoclosmatium globosum]|eukprot:ORY52495.1 hypothetical protein BCR33DRAFT_779780 [Rhizoclosmatium globosum]